MKNNKNFVNKINEMFYEDENTNYPEFKGLKFGGIIKVFKAKVGGLHKSIKK